MPVKTERRDGKWRVVEASTGRIARRKGGKPMDSGGFASRAGATAQASAVNLSMRRREGKSAPPPRRRRGR